MADPLTFTETQCATCGGTGMIRHYPRDSQWCVPCRGTGVVRVAAPATAYACNRCQSVWPARMGLGCPDCGAQATHVSTDFVEADGEATDG